MQTEINNCLNVLKKGGIILYPTDTVWGIGCDATNYEAVERIFQLKKRADNKSMICLVKDFKMLNQYIEDIPEVTYDIIKYAVTPTTIIYDRPLHVAENLIADDNSIAIRVVRDGFVGQLIKKFKKPIVSTSANLSGKATPNNFQEINKKILEGVGYVVELGQKGNSNKPSSIIKITTTGSVTVIRK
jgi:L-threonylcarbamoyladenylate synthase